MNWADANFLPWLIPLPPLIAFALIILVAGRSRLITHLIAIGGMLLSWLFSFSVFLRAIQTSGLGKASVGVYGSSITQLLGGQNWLVNGTGGAGSGALNMGVMVDPLTAVMLFMVPLACLAIFVYSLGYMAHDSRNPRFFAYLSLFAGAMLTLVLADNLLLLFIGWEVMGLCSYLLIGFWYDRSPEQEVDQVAPFQAAIKAFITTRAADVIMLIGIAYLWASTGTLSFREIFFNPETLEALGSTPALGGFLGLSAAGLIGVCLITGTVGKSAQFPLHVWLPDAMKGPTPVSAMIHAAAMVSAGVYMIIRVFPILHVGSNPEEGIFGAPMVYMAVLGAFTAIFAASIAIAQNDIKKVLAYSTVSQLGFMVAVLGLGGFAAAAFHLITHAFFKALLFMASGSVIHGMEHGHHVAHAAAHGGHSGHSGHGAHSEPGEPGTHGEHGEHDAHAPAAHEPPFDPQDMRNMGGLLRTMPVTAITFIIGGMSLAGLPLLTAGFWSKDEILLEALTVSAKNPIGLFALILLSLAAVLTAIYTVRQIGMVFLGTPRTEAAMNAKHYDPARGDGVAERNVSINMTAPLIVLAVFAVVTGFVGVNPSFPVLGPLLSRLGVEKPFIKYVQNTLLEPPHLPDFNILAVLLSFTIFIVGAGVGYALYIRRPVVLGQPDPVEGIVGPAAYHVLRNKYFIDEFYARYLIAPFRWIADRLVNVIIDKGIIDGALHFVARLAGRIGDLFKEFNRVVIDGVGDGIPEAIADAARGLRPMQTGRVQQYLLFALIAAIVVGVNLVVLAVAPNLVTPLVIVQGAVAILLVLFFGSGSQSSDKTPSTGAGD